MSRNLPELYKSELNKYAPIKHEKKLTKIERANKEFVDRVTKKYFRGFDNIKKSKELRLTSEKNFIKNSPLYIWEEPDPYPFEEKFNLTYKTRFLSKLKGPNFGNVFNIQKINYKNQTYKKPKYRLKTPKNPEKEEEKEREKEEKKNLIIKQLYPNGLQETEKINTVTLFSIEKNKWEKSNVYGNVDNDPYIEAEFLFKISQPEKETTTPMNFNSNQGLKTGSTYTKCKSLSKKPNLEIGVQNLSTSHKMSLKEKRRLAFDEKVNLIKNFPNEMLKNFEDDLFNDEDKDYETEKEKNFANQIGTSSQPNFTSSYTQVDFFKRFDKPEKEDKGKGAINKTTSYPLKRTPSTLSKTKYINKQMNNYKNRFEYIHTLAFGDNTNNFRTNKIYNPFKKSTPAINPKSHLLTHVPVTYKKNFEKDMRYRDMLITNKLEKCYTKTDAERLLRGRQPLSDLIK